MSKHGDKASIARELGISGAAVTKLARKGMPVDDADAARRWRAANLNPARLRPDPGPSADTLLRRAQRLMDLAENARQGHLLHTVADDLRAAMRAVPESHRGKLRLSFHVMRELLGPTVCADLDALEAPAADDLQPLFSDAGELDEFIGAVLYMVACGEAKF